MSARTKVRIVWNGQGGELDSVIAFDDGDTAISKALILMIVGKIVSPGDSFTVEEIVS